MLEFITNLFGSKKSPEDDTVAQPKPKKGNGYYLELDETGNTKSEGATEPAKSETASAPVATAKPETVKLSAPEKPEPAKAKVETQNGKVTIQAQPNPPSNNGKVDPDSERTFAPNYLIKTVNSSRRRPGPSMAMFREMARQVKNPG